MLNDTTSALPDYVRRALRHGGTIDITTTGRRTGTPRRIEIVYHVLDGRIYISGTPRADRARAWLLNLAADPRLTFHLKGTISADLPATARIITDDAERRRVFAYIVTVWRGQEIETMTRYSPLIEVTIEGLEPEPAA
jgi:deazaflavin-dependent oxidoreductase (nitroreductase family)